MSRQATGLRAWVLQRITAVYVGLYIIYLLIVFIVSPPDSFEYWRDWVGNPVSGIALLLFFASVLLHAWVGLRDILIDYVQFSTLRITLLSLIGLGLVGCGLWVARVVFLAGVPG